MRRATSAQRAPQRSRGNVVSSLQLDAHGARTAAFSMSRLDADQSRNSCVATNPGAAGPPAEMRTAGCNRPSTCQSKLSAQIVVDSGGAGKAAMSPTTLAAQYEVLGYSLHELSDGSFLACRWGYSRPLQSRYEAQLFYRQIGGRA